MLRADKCVVAALDFERCPVALGIALGSQDCFQGVGHVDDDTGLSVLHYRRVSVDDARVPGRRPECRVMVEGAKIAAGCCAQEIEEKLVVAINADVYTRFVAHTGDAHEHAAHGGIVRCVAGCSEHTPACRRGT